jgi:hypothetical protein
MAIVTVICLVLLFMEMSPDKGTRDKAAEILHKPWF